MGRKKSATTMQNGRRDASRTKGRSERGEWVAREGKKKDAYNDAPTAFRW